MKHSVTLLLVGMGYIALTAWASDFEFFWDTVQLGAKHGTWYYEQQFRYLLLPPEIDSGHPPVFGMYLAACWLLFGKSLAVSHWAMLPFLLGLGWQTYRLVRFFLPDDWVAPVMLLLLIEPTLLAQCVLISPDVVLMCFLVWSLNALLRRSDVTKSFVLIGLALISMRGMMCVLALYLVDVWYTTYHVGKRLTIRHTLQTMVAYLPSGILASAFLAYHYAETGWVGYHADSPWAPSFDKVDARGLLRNIAVLGWRLLDFGKVAVFVVVGIAWLGWRRRANPIDDRLRTLLVLTGILVALLTPSLLVHAGLLGHRYLLPYTYMGLLSALYFVLHTYQRSWKRWLALGAILVAFVSGHRWVYPDKISQGWDASLAHLPYYQLRDVVNEELAAMGIPRASVGSAFPLVAEQRYYDLSSSTDAYARKDLYHQEYILYSNIVNDFTDDEIDRLQDLWVVEQEWQQAGVKFVLYRRDAAEI